MEAAEERALLHRVFERRAAHFARAAQCSLHNMLNNLEEQHPHLFALPAAKLNQTQTNNKPWEPNDKSEKEVERAYKRATYYLHPDRLTNRDVSICVEAEEVLKVLTHAHAHKDNWGTRDDLAQPGAPSETVAENFQYRAESRYRDMSGDIDPRHRATSGGGTGGSDVRDSIFGGSSKAAAPAAEVSVRRKARAPAGPGTGGTDVRDAIFGATSEGGLAAGNEVMDAVFAFPGPSRQRSEAGPFSSTDPFSSSCPFSQEVETATAAAAAADDLFGRTSSYSDNPFGLEEDSNPFGAEENPFVSKTSAAPASSAGPFAFSGLEACLGAGEQERAREDSNPFS